MGIAVACALIAVSLGGLMPWHLVAGLLGGILAVAASFTPGGTAQSTLGKLGIVASSVSLAGGVVGSTTLSAA